MKNIVYLNKGEKLFLPSLQENEHLESPYFIVSDKFAGGMGTCYKIIASNNIPYALKMIHSDLILEHDYFNRYIDELKKWISFSSCNGILEAICTVNVNDIPCVVSRWMDGGDMSSVISSLNKDDFYSCMDRIIVTLKWVYDNFKVIHRDLKPGNILIGKDKEAYIGDWGLAKIVSSIDVNNLPKSISPDVNETNGFVGTVVYASPEQIMNKKNIDFRSDIYSLGCMMYEWETGKPPFLGKTLQQIASSHIYTKPQKLGGFFKKTNFRAESMIMKCLEKDPKDRFQSYDELIQEFHKLATKYCDNFKPFIIREKYAPFNVGYDEFTKKLKNHEFEAIYAPKGNAVIVSQDDIQPHLNEALSLLNLGESEKAINILKGFYMDANLVRKYPDMGFHQFVGVNLAFAYNNINKPDSAISVLELLTGAKKLSAEYYVNLSNAYIHKLNFDQVEKICRQGLAIYPNDPDIIGNLIVALSSLDRPDEAIDYVNKRLRFGRNVHSLCEAAMVFYKSAEQHKNTNFPIAIERYKASLSLYREAERLNPKYQSALYNIALLLFKLRRYKDSIEQCNKIASIEKGKTEVNCFYITRNLLWSGDFKQAYEFGNKCLGVLPNSTMLKRITSEVLVDGFVIGCKDKNGNHVIDEFSWKFFDSIVEDKKHRLPSDLVFYARIHFWMDDTDEINKAFTMLENGIDAYPNYWKYDFELAQNCLKYDLDGALDLALSCNRKAPWREKTYLLLIEAYKKEGGPDAQQKIIACQRKYDEIKKKKDSLYASCANI